MTLFKSAIIKLITLLTLLFSTSSVFAGVSGTMTMSFAAGNPENIPSLSGMMLIVLSLLLFAIAFRTAKQKESNKLFVSLITSGALLAVLGGAGQLKNSIDVHAGWVILPPPPQTINFDRNNTTQIIREFTNSYANADTNLIATIETIETNPSCSLITGIPNECQLGQTLAPGASCDLNLDCVLIIPPTDLSTE